MSGPASESTRLVLAVADLFARVGTDPLIDWARPSVLLTHPLQRTTVVPYVRGADLGRAVAFERCMWTTDDPLEQRLVSMALRDLEPDAWASLRVEQLDEELWSAEAVRLVELDGPLGDWDLLTLQQWWVELAVQRALPRLAAAMQSALDLLPTPRALVLRHAFGLLGDGPDADGSFGERVELAAVECRHVTLSLGEDRLPVLLRYDEDDDQLEVLTLLAGFDGRSSRSELDALRSVVVGRARGREGLKVVDVPGELATAIGVVTRLAPSVETATLRRVLEAHLDVARGDGGMGIVRA